MNSTRSLHIALVAGEASGDTLGAGLMLALRELYPNIKFSGIGGPKMLAEGLVPLEPYTTFSVMGFSDVLAKYPKILATKRKLLKYFRNHRPDIFIGVDFSSFNLSLASSLKKIGIKTIQYVCPKIWASRPERLSLLRESCDLVLCLFPFEVPHLKEQGVNAEFVGHPLASLIPMRPNQDKAQESLNIDKSKKTIAVLVGSRTAEVKRIGPLFIKTLLKLNQIHPNLQYVFPLALTKATESFKRALSKLAKNNNIHIIPGNSHLAIESADIVLTKCGTATLEAMLYKKPMVVAYKTDWLTYKLVKSKLQISEYSLPNILSGKALVKEFIQGDAKAEYIAAEISNLLEKSFEATHNEFCDIHRQLINKNSARSLPQAVLSII